MKMFKGIRNKGFSLVELIIVVAIMVALIAVLAPNYVKYVQRSRDAVIENSAESVSESIKIFYTDGLFKCGEGECVFLISKNNNGLLDLSLKTGTFSYNGLTGDNAMQELKKACGFENKSVNSEKQYIVTVSADDDSISMSSGSLADIDVEVEEVPET